MIERIGRCPLSINGAPADHAEINPGDVVTLKHELVLYCARRLRRMPPLLSLQSRRKPAFGGADEHGFVGESAAAWETRDQLAFCASSDRHVLLLGESGSGKELAAGALHQLSDRRRRVLVSRNAATFPTGLIDAELFGNVKDYPNSRMPARAGVIGEADGSTLFLDEIGELPEELQAHLLRVLDSGGEYQPLGDARVRHADFRFVAATNRNPTELKHDLLARLTLRVTLPSLRDRREDVPFLMRHLLRRAASKNEQIHSRFFDIPGGHDSQELGEARVHPNLVEALLTHKYTHNVRELDALLWRAIAGSKGRFIDLVPEVRGEIKRDEDLNKVRAREPTVEEIKGCLERHGGNISKAWVDLGLKSRYALYRLLKKHEISIRSS